MNPQNRAAPLVGRERELCLLEAALRHAAAGRGSVVLIAGEAGIGKTRFCEEVGARHAADLANGDRAALWVLDDLPRVDESTWTFVLDTSGRIAGLRLVLAVTYRDEELVPAHPRWPDLARLRRGPGVVELRLPRLGPADAAQLARGVAPGLPEAALHAVVERGAGMPRLIEELAGLAGDLLGAGLLGPPSVNGLTPREREVAELVAQGLTNQAIAARLRLGRPTVASHVAHILAKLDFASRAQIAAWVAHGRGLAAAGDEHAGLRVLPGA